MSEENTVNPPKWLMIVAGLALIWNLLGVMAFAMQAMMTPEKIALLSQAEQDMYAATPLWVLIAFGCGVFGGTFGSIGLLMRKACAMPLFVISLIGVLVQMYHSLFIIKSYEVYGPGSTVMPIMVILIAIALVWLANKAKKSGWLS